MDVIAGTLVPISVCVVLPVLIVYFTLKNKANQENNRKEIVLAALEKNADLDIGSLIRQMNPPEKLLKEKLLKQFQAGCFMAFAGIGVLLAVPAAYFMGYADGKSAVVFAGVGCIAVLLGLANLISYRVGKRMLAKEMEAEEARMENGDR